MASWRDGLREASFRGVPFLVQTASGEGGRQSVLHRIPGSEKAPFVEDLGFAGGDHNIEGFVLGDDYMAQAVKLRQALDQPGAGSLIHPTLGQRTVALTPGQRYTWREDLVREGRMCRFTMPFTDTAANILPSSTPDTAQKVQDAATGMQVFAKAALAKKFTVAGKAQWVATAAKTKMQELNDALMDARKAFPAIPTAVTQFVAQAQDVSSSVASLIRAPLDLADSITNLVGLAALLPQQPRDSLAMLGLLFGFGDDDSAPDTGSASRAQANANAKAVNQLTQVSALAEAARVMSTLDLTGSAKGDTAPSGFTSADDIAGVRDDLLEQFDKQLQAADDDDLFAAIQDLRDATLEHLDLTSAQLPQLVTFTPPATLPAVVLAYRLYLDPTRDQEIVDRNRVAHPGFLVGGAELEVLDG